MIYLYDLYDIKNEGSEWRVCEGEPGVRHSGQAICEVIAIDSGSLEHFASQYHDDANNVFAINDFVLCVFEDEKRGTWLEECGELSSSCDGYVTTLTREQTEVVAEWIVETLEEYACMEERGCTLSDFDEHNIWNKTQLGLK